MHLCLVHEDPSDGTDACVPVDLCTEHAESLRQTRNSTWILFVAPIVSIRIIMCPSMFWVIATLHSRTQSTVTTVSCLLFQHYTGVVEEVLYKAWLFRVYPQKSLGHMFPKTIAFLTLMKGSVVWMRCEQMSSESHAVLGSFHFNWSLTIHLFTQIYSHMMHNSVDLLCMCVCIICQWACGTFIGSYVSGIHYGVERSLNPRHKLSMYTVLKQQLLVRFTGVSWCVPVCDTIKIYLSSSWCDAHSRVEVSTGTLSNIVLECDSWWTQSNMWLLCINGWDFSV